MPAYTPEEISNFLQDAIETNKDDSGRMIIILSNHKQIVVSVRNWNSYLLSLEDDFSDDDYRFPDDPRELDFST